MRILHMIKCIALLFVELERIALQGVVTLRSLTERNMYVQEASMNRRAIPASSEAARKKRGLVRANM